MKKLQTHTHTQNKKNKKTKKKKKLRFMKQIDEALQELHRELGCCHCDVAIPNIVVFNDRAVLIDFEMVEMIGLKTFGFKGSFLSLFKSIIFHFSLV